MNIPTAEELFKKYSNLYQFEEGSPEYLIDKEDFKKALKEYAKYHKDQALIIGADNATTREITTAISISPEWVVDKDSILNAYPDSNLK
jgi:hypothetical protein